MSVRHYTSAIMVALLTLFSAFICADEALVESASARALLDKMSHSQRELTYQGAFTYERGGKIQALRVFHSVIDNQEYERLEHLDGDKREVSRHGHGPQCIHPGDKLLRLFKAQNDNRAGVEYFYDFSIVGESRVAGRQVIELAVIPRDQYRFGHRLSLDHETALLLRSVQYDENNRILERFQFVNLSLPESIPASVFEGSKQVFEAEHVAPPQSSTDNVYHWRLDWLPGGFTAVTNPKIEAGMEMMTFTDGLASFSIFVEPNISNPAFTHGRAQRGATMVYSRSVSIHGIDYRVTVLGEIPLLTAERLVNAVIAAE